MRPMPEILFRFFFLRMRRRISAISARTVAAWRFRRGSERGRLLKGADALEGTVKLAAAQGCARRSCERAARDIFVRHAPLRTTRLRRSIRAHGTVNARTVDIDIEMVFYGGPTNARGRTRGWRDEAERDYERAERGIVARCMSVLN